MKYPLLLVAALALFGAPAFAKLSTEQAAKRGLAALVVVRAERKGASPTQASGFFVDKNVVATLASVVQGADRVHVRLPGEDKWLEIGPVVARDKHNDLILLELKDKAQARPLSFAREDPSIGQTVYAIAAPPKTRGVFHRGLVSGIVENGGRTFVQMDALVQPGAEGGVLLDEDGNVAGVLAAASGDARFSFAVPGSILRALKNEPRSKDPLAGVNLSAAAAWERGALAERERRWADAARAYEDVMRLEPTLNRARKHHARALAGQDRLPEATAGFIAYLDKEPDDLDARFELAEVMRKRERASEAFDLFTAYAAKEKRQSRNAYTGHAKRVMRELTRSFERRVAILPLSAAEGVAAAAAVEKELKARVDAKTQLELVDPAEVPLDALPRADASCRQQPRCIWKPAWSRFILTGTMVPPAEGQAVALDLELFDVRAKKRVAEAKVRSAGGNNLPLDIDDGLAVLMADLPPELAGTLKRREGGGGGRRPLLLDDDTAPPDDVGSGFDDNSPTAATTTRSSSSPEAGGASGSSSASKAAPAPARRSLRDVKEPPARDKRRVAVADAQASRGVPVVPWLLIGAGVAVAGAGLAFDLLSPSSANYNIGLLDFVGPAAVGVGAAALIGGVVMGPFGGKDED